MRNVYRDEILRRDKNAVGSRKTVMAAVRANGRKYRLTAITGREQLTGRKTRETKSLATGAGVKVTSDRSARVARMKRRKMRRSTRSTRRPSERLGVHCTKPLPTATKNAGHKKVVHTW